ncbi:MAG TPA: S8 family serine peptidase [Blastocatellia bacterium]|nr:S8 family serine peptidase [Blastocatellia bacterium]
MISRIRYQVYVLAVILTMIIGASISEAATLSSTLRDKLTNITGNVPVGVVIISFNGNQGLNESHLNILRGLGITKGLTFNNLGMVAAPATLDQVRALAANGSVRSVWSNDRLYYYMKEARVVTGVDRVRADSAMRAANGSMPVTGQGDFSVVINDSGIDATHSDLSFGSKVIQNVQMLTDTATLAGFTPVIGIENQPNTDTHVGHGTHCAGIVGGTGLRSGGLYSGVAPGAKLIGVGSGYGLFILNALGGFEWSLANQPLHKIRIISNSWGSAGPFEPDDPIHIASHTAFERNILSVFAAGNSGPGKGTYNRYAKAPWVIGVAAGTKEGGLASFSSRGLPRSERLGNSDTLDDFDAPTITAPGTGREFESNAGRFSAAMVSTRAITNIVSNGLTDDLEIPLAFLPFYTQISGTSMATPFVAGVAALMLDADPTLSAEELKQILVETASRMPGFEDHEVGAGYVNAYAAVDKVFNRSKDYGSFVTPTFNLQFSVSGPAPEPFHVDYNPAALPGPGSANSRPFTVAPGMSVLDVFATFDTVIETGDGNTIGILLTSPSGVTHSSGIALPILDGRTRQVVVRNPEPGPWLLEVRGVRGLAAAPNASLPTSGAAAPGPVDGTITQQRFELPHIPDIQGHPAQADIEFALRNRLMDIYPDGSFWPSGNVTRESFARLLVQNTPVRQTLATTPRFTDVTSEFAPYAEAVTANGSTLRDFDFAPEGMVLRTTSLFKPADSIIRRDLAVALVRALGLDAQARGMAGRSITVTHNGQTLTLADNSEIPLALRGYVQLALDKGILQAFFTLEQGPLDLQPTLKARVKANDPVTRDFVAVALANFREHFVAGN